jgi:hypothetical protein
MCGVQVWRCPQSAALWQQLFPGFHTLPGPYQAARHYHLVLHASHPPMELLQQLREVAHARGGEAPSLYACPQGCPTATYLCCVTPDQHTRHAHQR